MISLNGISGVPANSTFKGPSLCITMFGWIFLVVIAKKEIES